MTTLIDVPTIEKVVGALSGDDLARVEEFLDEASSLAREIGTETWTDAAGGNPAPASVRLAVKRAVLRAYFEDPEGYDSETLGDWSGSRRSTGLDESGVFFTKAEADRIRETAGRRAGVGSVRTSAAYPADLAAPAVTLYAPSDGPWGPIPLLSGGGA